MPPKSPVVLNLPVLSAFTVEIGYTVPIEPYTNIQPKISATFTVENGTEQLPDFAPQIAAMRTALINAAILPVVESQSASARVTNALFDFVEDGQEYEPEHVRRVCETISNVSPTFRWLLLTDKPTARAFAVKRMMAVQKLAEDERLAREEAERRNNLLHLENGGNEIPF